MNDVSIEQIITGSFVRYNVLSKLIQQSYAGSNCNEINLFIDLNSAIKSVYSVSYPTIVNDFSVAATVLNMCGHYRDFFRNLGVATNIYLIYGLNCPNSNNTFVKGYNNKFVQSYIKKPYITKVIEDNLNILEVLTQYLPKIYYFNIGNCEVSSMIHYIIAHTNSVSHGIENIVISKDILALQLIPECNVRVIRPYKSKGEDLSFIVDNTNLWQHFICDYRKGKTPKVNISNNFISNILAMTRVNERSMPSIFDIPKAFHIINIATSNGFLDSSKFYTQSNLNTALEALDVPHNPVALDMRYKAINTTYQANYILPLENPKIKMLRLIDLEDVNTLKNIINRYFIDNPIDLNKL